MYCPEYRGFKIRVKMDKQRKAAHKRINKYWERRFKEAITPDKKLAVLTIARETIMDAPKTIRAAWDAHFAAAIDKQAERLSNELLLPLLKAAWHNGKLWRDTAYDWDKLEPNLQRELPKNSMVKSAVKTLMREAYHAEHRAGDTERDDG